MALQFAARALTLVTSIERLAPVEQPPRSDEAHETQQTGVRPEGRSGGRRTHKRHPGVLMRLDRASVFVHFDCAAEQTEPPPSNRRCAELG